MDYNNEIPAENLTQKDIMLHLLQVAQHSATREDVKNDINNLDVKIDKLDTKIDKLETSLKEDINKLDTRMDKLDTKIDKVSNKFDKIQWLIISTILTVLLKDYIIAFFKGLSG